MDGQECQESITMYEVRRYDGQGNLIETISAKQVEKNHWKDFDKRKEIPASKLKESTNAGMFHLIMPLESNQPEKKCAYCGETFTPPRYRPNAKFCHKPGVKESLQCRRLDYKKRTLKPPIKKTCLYCGSDYMSSRANSRYCPDPGCNKNAVEKQKRNARAGRKIRCKYCRVLFYTKNTHREYCLLPYFVKALQCQEVARRERNRNKMTYPAR